MARGTMGRAWLSILVTFSALVVPLQDPEPVPLDEDSSSAALRDDHAADQQGSGRNHSGSGDGHAHDEGLALSTGEHGPLASGSTCTDDRPVRDLDVMAIDVDITVNRYLDHDPRGRMFVLADDLDRVRAEEQANADARSSGTEPAVTAGLQGDAIQPLVIRALPGECLRIRLRNDLNAADGPSASSPLASIDLHGAAWKLSSGAPATASDPRSFAAPGRTVTYEWAIPDDQSPGTHYFHSTGDERLQTSHGLFGALVVEPPGSRWLDPRSGEQLRSGWDAIVVRSDGSAFREFALLYHEIGDETYQLVEAEGEFLPLVDDTTGAYRPASRALNYRSEPFRNRLELGREATGTIDRSLAYSSYSYGDPATPIIRTELGDPTVQRVVHAGSEVHHVHHVHGGSVRWPRQPGTQESEPLPGLDKAPPLTPAASERTDSQTLGPSETFDVIDECTAGGCQQSPGDVMYHCHIAHHYVAGMWGIWRVYNTAQEAGSQTDALPPLLALPDRTRALEPAVTSAELAGTTITGDASDDALDDAALRAWVRRVLPSPGVRKGYDASVWDWVWDGQTARGESEDDRVWPGYRSRSPGSRPAILFDPISGKPAFPHMRPHLASRPPFPRDHAPAPYLDPPDVEATRPGATAPGANGPSSLCPSGTEVQTFAINAIRTLIALDPVAPVLDPDGTVFVLRSNRDAVQADPTRPVPLTIRANAGEDCVDVLLRSELDDSESDPFSKVSLHIHHVQFDLQGSDGVANGFNYEQSIRPYASTALPLRVAARAGDTELSVPGALDRFSPDTVVGVGLDEDGSFEEARVIEVRPDAIVLGAPLLSAHPAGSLVGTEYLHHRWFPDVQFGTAYFHDHVDAIHRWRHGLVGALIAEPPGSTYTDPRTGEDLRSGLVADITTEAAVSTDVIGPFREFAVHLQDDNPLSREGRSSGGAMGLRVAPLERRDGDPTRTFSSEMHGDPPTGVLDTIVGDPVVLRTLVSATNDVHTFHVDGHWFRPELWSAASRPVDTIRVGISERYDLVIPSAGGPRHQPGDYLMRSGRIDKLAEGVWSILRVHRPDAPGAPRALAGRSEPEVPDSVCPAGAPRRTLAVDAISVGVPMLGRHVGKIYVDRSRVEAVLDGTAPVEPYVAHVTVGDCIIVDLGNRTGDGPVSFHATGLAYDPATSGGVAVGREPAQVVADGERRTFEFYASPEVGETTALVHDYAEPTANVRLGLYGAIVVGAAGTRWEGSGPEVVGVPPEGRAYRDVTLLLHDEDAGIGTHRMPYTTTLGETHGLNYVTAGGPPGPGAESPAPELRAHPGDPVRIHVLSPVSSQVGVFGVEGHAWPSEPSMSGSNRVAATSIGGLEHVEIQFEAGPTGPGRYVYGMQRGAYRDSGMWGWLVVDESVQELPGGPSAPPGRSRQFAFAGFVALVVLALIAIRRTRVGPGVTVPPGGSGGIA